MADGLIHYCPFSIECPGNGSFTTAIGDDNTGHPTVQRGACGQKLDAHAAGR